MNFRRCMICAALALAITMLSAHGAEPPTVGLLSLGTDPADRSFPSWSRFYAKMRELGWLEGQNIRYLPRAGMGDLAKADAVMKEFVDARVAVIVTTGSQEVLAAKRATRTIPVVALHPSDPVDLGVAASLARPGGNITGQTLRAPGIGGKQLELIAEMQPSAKRFVFGQSISVHPMVVVEADEAARKRGVKFASSDMPHTGDYDAWIAKTKREGVHAMIFTLDASTFAPARRTALAAALIKHKLPAMCGVAEYVEAGCLMSYGAAFIEFYPRGAEYVDKILRGVKPGELPIEQPTKFELVINLKTAKALGIKVPRSILLRADRVIE